MRELVLDTETTGLDPRNGDRIVEIGAVELINRVPTGETFHKYINPERDMPRGAFEVHGLSEEFLSDKPVFSAIADDFLAFAGTGTLVIHNASFDMGFINMELDRLGHPAIPNDQVLDTLGLARKKHPVGANSLDALCSRYGIDNSRRTKHGALLDAELLAEVYIELTGGRQADLGLGIAGASSDAGPGIANRPVRQRPQPLAPRLTDDDRVAHKAFIDTLGDDPVWKRYPAPPAKD